MHINMKTNIHVLLLTEFCQVVYNIMWQVNFLFLREAHTSSSDDHADEIGCGVRITEKSLRWVHARAIC